jgi:hypothetical protein
MYKPTPIEPQDTTNFQQKLDITFLTLQQMQKVSQSAFEGDEIKYSNAIESLLAMLPKANREKIEANKDAYITKIEQPRYKYSCGKPMGTIENPVYRNNPLDWNYKGGKPELVSPVVEEVEQVDYAKLYKLILEELEDVGVTWKQEARDKIEKLVKAPPTPLVRLQDGKFVRVIQSESLAEVQPSEEEIPEVEDIEDDLDEEEEDK